MANKGLCIHAGGYAATMDQVANVVTPPATDTHYPIAHEALIGHLRNSFTQGGLEVVSEQHALHTLREHEGANYFGLFEIECDNSHYNIVVGLRNSHVMAFSAGLLIGEQLFICDNLAFSGEIKFARKHTRFINRDIPAVVARAVGKLGNHRQQQEERITLYQGAKLDRAEADHAVIELLRARAFPSKDVIKVVDEFNNPRHPEHLDADGDRTVWTLFNAVTEVATKGTNVFKLPARSNALHGVCDLTANRIRQRAPVTIDQVADAA